MCIRDSHQIGRRGLENLVTVLLLMHIHHDVPVAVQDPREGKGLLIDALVGDGAEGNGQLHRCDAGGTQGQAKGIRVDIRILNAHQMEVFHRTGYAHIGHQNLRRGGVVGIAQRRS